MVENFPKSVKILTTVLRLQKIPSKIITKTYTHTQANMHKYNIRQVRLKNKK